jgi:hypothetical protein
MEVKNSIKLFTAFIVTANLNIIDKIKAMTNKIIDAFIKNPAKNVLMIFSKLEFPPPII